LDNVKGHFLDRIGKLLSEYRNGNTDEYYRILLKLRRLLNTNDGSIPSIIEAVKFFYSSEIVHIVPDYPAGLIIEHDGEGTPGLNFNKLLAEIIPAGVSFSTKELFYFKEELPSSETVSKISAATQMKDYMGYIFRNGVYRRNGQLRRYYIVAEDFLTINLKPSFEDQLFGRAVRDGLFKHNGIIRNDTFTNDVATDILLFNGMINYLDNLSVDEETAVAILQEMSDTASISDLLSVSLVIGLQDSVSLSEDASEKIKILLQEPLSVDEKTAAIMEWEASDTVSIDDLLSTSLAIASQDSVSISENVSEKIKLLLFQEPLSVDEKTAAVMAYEVFDTPHKGIFRNGLIRRSGKYNRAENIIESMTIGYRKHHSHNGRYRRNGSVKHDNNVLYPLEA
jgi:hypothetical protein